MSKQAKHTPGSWRFLPTHWAGGSRFGPWNRIYIEATGQGGEIARVQHHGTGTGNDKCPTDEDYANARLIAAAPDLLAAGKCALADLDSMAEALAITMSDSGDVPPATTARELRAAIAKAE